jgi:hypothetical protein
MVILLNQVHLGPSGRCSVPLKKANTETRTFAVVALHATGVARAAATSLAHSSSAFLGTARGWWSLLDVVRKSSS